MRVAALAFGVLAGLVASFILALGGLDVSPGLAASGDRQVQAIRFGLYVVANLGIFGAALALASPLAGGIFLLLGAIAWVASALLLHHSTDFVLVTPPALLLLATIFAFVAHFRRPREADEEDSDVEIISPARAERAPLAAAAAAPEPGITIPAFAAEPARRGNADEGMRGPLENTWNPRKRQPPPPRTKPAFREVAEDEEEEDDEPSGLGRFAMGISSVLSFGLYAALAAAAVLAFWGLREGGPFNNPAVAVANSPAVVSSSEPVSVAAAPSTSELVLAPILPSQTEVAAIAPPSAEPLALEPAAEALPSEDNFGDVLESADPLAPPRLVQDDPAAVTAAPSSAEPALEPAPADPAAVAPPIALQTPSVAAPGQVMPRTVPPQMAALRAAPGTGPIQSAPSSPATLQLNTTGL